ncbi:MAG: hypothetical protein U0X76_03535 [Bacteroidia bacterium]
MKEYKEIRSILLTFNEQERRALVNKLRFNNETSVNGLSQRLIQGLFEESISEKELHKRVYSNYNPSAFRKLISRNLESSMDVLLTYDSINSIEKYDERAKDIFILERKILLAEILRYRGAFELSSRLLESVIKNAKEYEHYSVLVNAIEKKLKFNSADLDSKEYVELERELSKYLKVRIRLNYVIRIYTKFVLRLPKLNRDQSNVLTLNLLNRVRELANQTNSKTILLYYNYIYLQYLAVNKDFAEGYQHALEILSLTKDSNCLRSNQRLVFIYFNLALFSRYNLNFDLALSYLNEANKYSFGKVYNSSLYFEGSFLCYLNLGDFKKAKYYLKLLFTSEHLAVETNLVDYYQSICCYLDGDVKQAIKWNKSINRGAKTNVELNLNSRILLILELFECDEYDLIVREIDNLRKQFENLRLKGGDINLRLQHIIKLLQCLERSDFNFKTVMTQKKHYIDSLCSLEYSWKPNSLELIIFEEWFESKLKGVPYHHKTAVDNVRRRLKAVVV